MASKVIGFVFSDDSFFNAEVSALEMERLTGEHGTWYSAMLAEEMAKNFNITVSSSQLESVIVGGKFQETTECGQLYQVKNLEIEDKRETLNEDEKNHWTHQQVLLLIETYRLNKHLFESSSKKLDVWKKISTELSKKGAKQTPSHCEKKFSNLKQRYKAIKDHNSKTGRDNKSYKYYEELDKIFGGDPAITPPITISSMSGTKENEIPSCNLKEPKRKLFQTPTSEELDSSEQRKTKKRCHETQPPAWFLNWAEKSNNLMEGILHECKRKNDILEKLLEKL